MSEDTELENAARTNINESFAWFTGRRRWQKYHFNVVRHNNDGGKRENTHIIKREVSRNWTDIKSGQNLERTKYGTLKTGSYDDVAVRFAIEYCGQYAAMRLNQP